jgi:pimeloyl-ACP methyl ester carboxylesterase
MWLHQHPTNNSLLVFLHGFFGDIRSWKAFFAFIQGVKDQVPWAGYDAYSFHYPTQLYNQPPLDPVVLRLLDQFLSCDFVRMRYATIILIGHSQGGILAKLYVLDKIRSKLATQLKVDMIITICTPHLGPRFPYSSLLSGLSLLDKLPLIRLLLPYRQARDLCGESTNLNVLRDYWKPPFVSSTSNDDSSSSRFVRSVAMIGRRDAFVSDRSARGFSAIDEIRYIDSGHGIEPYELQQPLFEYLESHLRPSAVLEQIAVLNSEEKLREYVQKYTPLAEAVISSVLISSKRPTPESYVSALASTMLMDFPRDFVRRPLRKLSFESALTQYVTWRTEI